jgi:hypothetical protein
MLKKSCLVLVFLTVSITAAFAQSDTKITIDDLSAPQSPAFVLLGVSPANVERPETPKAFALNLLDKVTTSNGLPRNYALEVAPYWLASHPNLQFADYQNPNVRRSILQTLLISVGTAPIPGATETDDPIGTKIGLGARTAIFNGRANSGITRLVKQIESIDDEVFDLMEKEDDLLEAVKANPNDKQAAADLAAVQKSIVDTRAKTESLALQIQTLDAERVGFFLNIAGGQVWTVLEDDIRQSQTEKRGIWVTPSYRWRGCADDKDCESSVDAIAVVRALKEPANDTVWDYGGRLVWKGNKEFNVSLEALRRHQTGSATEDDDSNRTVGVLEYRIREDLILFGSFGQDFKQVTGTKPLVSFLGLNLGFGKKAVVGAKSEKTTK